MAPRGSARENLLIAAVKLIRAHGFAATSVDTLCLEAGVTKGAFFHHFKSKDELGREAADYWSVTTSALFAAAPYHDHADPLDRVLGYIDFRGELIQGEVCEFTCLVGTMVQETYMDVPEIRQACADSILGHARTLTEDITLAMQEHGITHAAWTPTSLARHTQAVLQGAFILAKATDGREIALQSVAHLRRYIELLFSTAQHRSAA